jgi:hypothetical protein
MGIYQHKPITQSMIDRFRPTRLAIKELAGMKYFCKSIVEDITNYPGSGVIWKKRIKKYGKDKINTLWVSEWYTDPHEIQQAALHFSKENAIVESTEWANQKPEDGLDGGRQTPEVLARIVSKTAGQKRTPEQNEEKSKRQTGRKKSQQWKDNRIGYDKTIYQWKNKITLEEVTMTRGEFVKTIMSKHTKYANQATWTIIHSRKPRFGWSIM